MGLSQLMEQAIDVAQKISTKLEQMIWFLTTNFFKENPDSYLSEGAFIEDDIIYNSSYSELIYDIGREEITRLCVTICDEDTHFEVYHRKRYFDPGELVYSSRHYYDNSFPDTVKLYLPEEWEEIILREFERRKTLK